MWVLLCVYFSTLARGVGEGWDLINMFNPAANFAPVPSQEPLANGSFVWFLILVSCV